MKRFSIICMIILIGLGGCEREMLLTEFTDYEFDYQPEIRIEAVLNTEFPEQSVVRIDYSIPVTDTTVFNKRDDDGDWVGFTDLNRNGKWDRGEPLNDDVGTDGYASVNNDYLQPDEGEGDGLPTPGEPHIDELDEIICQLHDSTFTVELFRKSTGEKVADFAWQAQADSFATIINYETEQKEIVRYGGYKLTQLLDSIKYNEEYEFLVSRDDREIRALFEPKPPVQFLTMFSAMNSDTLIVTEADTLAPVWTTGADPIVFWIKVEKIWRPDSIELVSDYPSAPLSVQNGMFLGGDFIGMYFPGLYRWTVYVPSHNYGRYVYSSLPITDSSVSNWRDEEGNVVLGCAGSMAPKSIYVRIDRPVEKLQE